MGSNKIFGPFKKSRPRKKICLKNYGFEKNIGPKKILGSKEILGPKKILDLKKFGVEKEFHAENFLWIKTNFLSEIFLGPK